jgi:hypothetical protein
MLLSTALSNAGAAGALARVPPAERRHPLGCVSETALEIDFTIASRFAFVNTWDEALTRRDRRAISAIDCKEFRRGAD